MESVAQNSLQPEWVPPRLGPGLWYLAGWIGLWVVALNPFIDFLFGLLSEASGAIGEDSALRPVLKAPMFISAAILFFRLPRKMAMILLTLGLVVAAVGLVRIAYSLDPIGGFDFKYLLKGPLLVLATFVVAYSAPVSQAYLYRWFGTWPAIWFLFVIVAIALHVMFGFGLATYELFAGFRSFFPSQNVLTLFLAVSWTFVFFRFGVLVKIFSVLLLLPAFLALGTKAGFLFFAVVMGITGYRWIRRESTILATLFVLLMGGIAALLLLDLQLVARLIIDTGIGGERTAVFIDRYGVLSGLFSQRDVLMREAFRMYADGGPIVWLFGFGYDNFMHTLGSFIGTPGHFVEIDFADALVGGGALGLLFYAGPLLITLLVLGRSYFNSRNRLILPFFSALLLFFVAGLTSGHSAFSGTASILQGVLLGASWRLFLLPQKQPYESE